MWEKTLEGWAMWKSKVIEEWRQDGRQAERREVILHTLAVRFPGQVSEELMRRVAAEAEKKKLDEWFDLALTAASFDDVRAKVMP